MYSKKIIIYCLLPLICGCFSCKNQYEDPYFSGKIILVEDVVNKIDLLYPTEIILDGIYYGFPAVYDTLIFFCNPNYVENFYDVFNLKNGSYLGGYNPGGLGPDETLAVGPVFQFYKENNDLKTLLLAPNEKELLLWNISQSLQESKTVYDSIIPYDWISEHSSAYLYISVINENEILAYVPAAPKTMDGKTSTLPYYQLRTLYSNKLIRNYPIFKKCIKSVNSTDFFSSSDCLKPDKSKIVQVMRFVPQINIIDVTSGEVKGYRLDESVEWPFNEKNNDILEISTYYTGVQVTDQYIFALYSEGKNDVEKRPHMIYVYNWDGILIKKIDLKGEYVATMFLDPVNNLLYTSNQMYTYEESTNNIFYYDLNQVL